MYKISDYLIISGLNKYGPPHFISGVIRNQIENGKVVKITKENIHHLLSVYSEPTDLFEKMDLLIEFISQKTKPDGGYHLFNLQNDYPIIFAKNQDEFDFIVSKVHEIKLLEIDSESFKEDKIRNFRLSMLGWKRVLENKKRKIDSKQAFVAMWFDPSFDEAWLNGFKIALEETGFKPIRIDKEEYGEKICDKMIAEIRKSGLFIADISGQRNNVFYEAGFAYGLGIDIIWTCQKDDEEKIKDIFDTRQYKHIIWTDIEDLKRQLKNRIEARIVDKSTIEYPV